MYKKFLFAAFINGIVTIIFSLGIEDVRLLIMIFFGLMVSDYIKWQFNISDTISKKSIRRKEE